MKQLLLCLTVILALSSTGAKKNIEGKRKSVIISPADTFADRVAPALYNILASNDEVIEYYRDFDGNMYRLRLTRRYLRLICKYAYYASYLNPSWGDRDLAAIKHLSVCYDESRFNPKAMHWDSWDKTWDWGIEQINDCNLTNQWKHFCRINYYNYKDKRILYNAAICMRYGAYLNQYFIDQDEATYKYDGKPHQHKIYQAMLDALYGDKSYSSSTIINHSNCK